MSAINTYRVEVKFYGRNIENKKGDRLLNMTAFLAEQSYGPVWFHENEGDAWVIYVKAEDASEAIGNVSKIHYSALKHILDTQVVQVEQKEISDNEGWP